MAIILGGGLGGLSMGYYLLKNQTIPKICLLEGSSRVGGWIKTVKTADYVFELGPRTIRPKGHNGFNTLNMIEDLDLSNKVHPLDGNHPAARNRMIYVNSELHKLPSNILSIFLKRKPFSKPLISAVFNDLKQSNKPNLKDDSIYNFVERRFGKEIADYAISPMICGICAGDAKEISVKFLMKTLFEYEQEHGGVIKGLWKSRYNQKPKDTLELGNLAAKAKNQKWNVYSLTGGLQTLPTALEHHLANNNVEIKCSSQVEELKFVDSNSVSVKGSSSLDVTGRHVYSALPAYSLAKLVSKEHPYLASKLNDIPYVTVGIVNLYFSGQHLEEAAFGFLVPPIENLPILGVVFDSCCMPDQKGTVLTVMLGGRWFDSKFGPHTSKAQLLNVALDHVKRILNIQNDPVFSNVEILHKCIPQYVVGHYEKVETIRKYIKSENLPISLIGSSYDGVGINDVIASAKNHAKEPI